MLAIAFASSRLQKISISRQRAARHSTFAKFVHLCTKKEIELDFVGLDGSLLVTLRSPHSLDVAKECLLFLHISQMSSDQSPCYLLYIGDYTTQLYYVGIILSHYKDRPISTMECQKDFECCSNPNRAEFLGERPGISLFQEPERPELLSEPAVSFYVGRT